MSAPFEIIVSPFTVWQAPTGTAFPLVGVTPASEWVKIGMNGNLNYSDEGVTVTHEQSIDTFTPDGATGPIKAARTAESLSISLTLWDLTLEQYMLALNSNTITTVSAGVGVPGTKKVGMSRNADVQLLALLIRGPSPYNDSLTLQYEVPFAYHMGSPEVTFNKANVAGLALEFGALVDPSASADERFGRIVAQTAAAT